MTLYNTTTTTTRSITYVCMLQQSCRKLFTDGVAINHNVRDYAVVYFSEAVKHLRNCAKCRNYST